MDNDLLELRNLDPAKYRQAEQIYELLTDPSNDLPQWPDERIQAGYTSTSGPGAVRRTQPFIDMLDADGAFTPGWKGLDYGVGWGRIATLMLRKGTPEQLDLVDAWEKTLDILAECNFKNRRWQISEVLKSGEIPENTYDFVYSFSVFTHLAPRAFWPNLEALARSAKNGGTVYFTVRHREFIAHIVEHHYPGRLDEISAAVDAQGYWYTPTQGNLGAENVFGEMIVSEEHLRDSLKHFGSLDYLGQPPNQMQHVYALRA